MCLVTDTLELFSFHIENNDVIDYWIIIFLSTLIFSSQNERRMKLQNCGVIFKIPYYIYFHRRHS